VPEINIWLVGNDDMMERYAPHAKGIHSNSTSTPEQKFILKPKHLLYTPHEQKPYSQDQEIMKVVTGDGEVDRNQIACR
jgi:hypothetical protein